MSRPLVVVVGDALLDMDLVGVARRICPDAPVPVVEDVEERPRPGGAGLAAALAAGDGTEVVLVAPLASDEDARRLRELLEPRLHVVALAFSGTTPVKRRVRVDGQSLARLDSGGASGTVGPVPLEAVRALRRAGAVLVSDYGRGATSHPALRSLLGDLSPRVPVVWDPHPGGAVPVPGARLVTPNAAEAAGFAAALGLEVRQAGGGALAADGARADALVRAWRVGAVAVTLGRRGALLSYGAGAPLVVPATQVHGGDPCGAGDRFAASAAALLAAGAVPTEAVAGAVTAATAFVAAGGASSYPHPRPPTPCSDHALVPGTGTPDPAAALVERVRAAGGTVVATGGCFDLLHAGHVATLRAARALGDCLVVCINSDASVRRLKGAGRPLVPAADRRRVLEALECVDAVAVFDEDTPESILERLRPDVWAKGGDYAGVELPEAGTLRGWGGQAVVLPYLDGRSTTALLRSATAGALHARSQPLEENRA